MEFVGSVNPVELARSGHSMLRSKGDEGLYVEFYDKEVYNAAATEKAQKEASEKGASPESVKPVFDKQIFCIIRPPGRLEEWNQPAREHDKARFPREWQQYLNGNQALGGGTALHELRGLAEDQITHLRGVGVHSIEQLAGATDSHLSAIGMGARELRDRARLWVLEREKAAPFDEMKAENEALKKRLEALEKAQPAREEKKGGK